MLDNFEIRIRDDVMRLGVFVCDSSAPEYRFDLRKPRLRVFFEKTRNFRYPVSIDGESLKKSGKSFRVRFLVLIGISHYKRIDYPNCDHKNE